MEASDPDLRAAKRYRPDASGEDPDPDAAFWPSHVETRDGPLSSFFDAVLEERPDLRERVRVVRSAGGSPASRDAGFVLYWARGNALRTEENPALDVAKLCAEFLELPLVALFHLSEAGSTRRRHMFLLQGWKEVCEELEREGIRAVCHVARPGRRNPSYMTMACRAALVVSEEPFTNPLLEDARRVALAPGNGVAPLALVDASCVLPARLCPPGKDLRAYAFEAATKASRRARISAAYAKVGRGGPAATPSLGLPISSDDLDDIGALVSLCHVDQAVASVSSTPGGQRHANRRWRDWIDGGGLAGYRKRRNNPLDESGSSRMSAYVNAGMVSPFRLAREGKSDHKFFQEYQTWRELGYSFVFRRPVTHNTIGCLPAWAQRTLRGRAEDGRAARLSLRDLEEGRTPEPLWNAMQMALVKTGELHNNLRMTWGKAIHHWSASPEEALERLEHLNNKYALDGSAPPSYVGILWCFGGFDSPSKRGEVPVLGSVKPKPVSAYRRVSAQALLRKHGLSSKPAGQPSVISLLQRGSR